MFHPAQNQMFDGIKHEFTFGGQSMMKVKFWIFWFSSVGTGVQLSS